MNEFRSRIIRAKNALTASDAELLVVGATDQMRYLTGWAEHGHERLIALILPAIGDSVFVVPQMNVSQASTNFAGIENVIGWTDEEGCEPVLASLFAKLKLTSSSSLIYIDDELAASHLLTIQSLVPVGRYKPAGSLLAELRQLKTKNELESLSSAAALIDEIFEETIRFLRAGITELEVQEYVLNACKIRKTTPSFTPLICFGTNSAVPHHHTSAAELKPGDMVIVDIGCTSDYYASDITRTVSFGEPNDPDARKIYGIVSQAHHAARNAVSPGITAEDIDSAARNVINESGYGEYFIHRTGHGIGLSTHEPPYIVNGNRTQLADSMCFSVEPGIYLPGRFGVRIENIFTVTSGGARSLNAEPPEELRILPVK